MSKCRTVMVHKKSIPSIINKCTLVMNAYKHNYTYLILLKSINQPGAVGELFPFYDPKSDSTDMTGTIAPYLDRDELNLLPDLSLTSLDRPRQDTYRTEPPLLIQQDFTAGKRCSKWYNTILTSCKYDFLSLVSDEGCLQPLDSGPCRQYVVKWYFDPKANSCAQFWFGGCQGNKNQFDTQQTCRKSCVKI